MQTEGYIMKNKRCYHMKKNDDKSQCKFLNDYFIFTLQLACRILFFFLFFLFLFFFCTIDNNYVR